MWVFFVTAVVALVAAVVVQRLASARHGVLAREIEREEREILERTGQRVEGVARGSFTIDGVIGGVPVRLEGRTHSRPPNDPDDDHARSVHLVTVGADLPDFVVCRRDDASGVFGAESPPATTTGSARFDARFVGNVESTRAAAYRAAAGGPRAWSSPTLADRLVDLELQWIEVAHGKVKLAFSPTYAASVDRVLAAGANVARIAAGSTELPIAPGPADPAPAPQIVGGGEDALWIACGVTLFAGPLSLLLGFLPPMREAMADTCCGPNDEIVLTSSEDEDGTSFGTECREHPEASMVPLHLLSLSIWATVVFGGATFFGVRGWPKRRS